LDAKLVDWANKDPKTNMLPAGLIFEQQVLNSEAMSFNIRYSGSEEGLRELRGLMRGFEICVVNASGRNQVPHQDQPPPYALSAPPVDMEVALRMSARPWVAGPEDAAAILHMPVEPQAGVPSGERARMPEVAGRQAPIQPVLDAIPPQGAAPQADAVHHEPPRRLVQPARAAAANGSDLLPSELREMGLKLAGAAMRNGPDAALNQFLKEAVQLGLNTSRIRDVLLSAARTSSALAEPGNYSALKQFAVRIAVWPRLSVAQRKEILAACANNPNNANNANNANNDVLGPMRHCQCLLGILDSDAQPTEKAEFGEACQKPEHLKRDVQLKPEVYGVNREYAGHLADEITAGTKRLAKELSLLKAPRVVLSKLDDGIKNQARVTDLRAERILRSGQMLCSSSTRIEGLKIASWALEAKDDGNRNFYEIAVENLKLPTRFSVRRN
jgi:hypothetical protein